MFPFRYVTDADRPPVHLFRNGLHQFCGCTIAKPRNPAVKFGESVFGIPENIIDNCGLGFRDLPLSQNEI